jgi:hopanoid biosynthesis associated protein HpnK
MVGAPAAADATARAHRMPGLAVGLHLVLVDGRPTLPSEALPDLVDSDGRLPARMVPLAIRIATRAGARAQLAQEMRAQFEAFRRTGLKLDHVNAHKHFHLHPVIAEMIFAIGGDFGMRGLRVPVEPAALGGTGDSLGDIAMRGWARRLRAKARARGLTVPDHVYGLRWSGGMTEERLLQVLDALPSEGTAEVYLHAATRDAFPGSAPGYRYRDELAALCSARAAEAVSAGRHRLAGYADPDPGAVRG